MRALKEIISGVSGMETTCEPTDEETKEKFMVDCWNRSAGELHKSDGYHCDVCNNKGSIWKAVQRADGHWTTMSGPCKCDEVRRSIRLMKKSGLGDVIRDKTFDRYEVNDGWQRAMKEKAMAYARHPDGWFFVGGQSGAGKSHLCTAICRQFLLEGRQVAYMRWDSDIPLLQGLQKKDPEGYQKKMDRLKKAKVLYIDDLYKPTTKDGVKQLPNSWDIRMTFELINHRYGCPGLLTIASSEWTQDELLDIDEATGGRIFEMAGSYGLSIGKDRSRNYRLRRAVKI